jgi:hypothetical protein
MHSTNPLATENASDSEQFNSEGRSVSGLTFAELLNRKAAWHPFKRDCACIRCFALAGGKILRVEMNGVVYYRRENLKPLPRTSTRTRTGRTKKGHSIMKEVTA